MTMIKNILGALIGFCFCGRLRPCPLHGGN
jgi:hypothetical protein